MTVLWFFIGLMVGGCLGVTVMCCFQINREEKEKANEIKQKENKEE